MKMKTIATVIAGAALLALQAQAQNLLQNGSFEQPAAGKIWTGYSSATQPDVPVWFTPGAQQAQDTGLENPGGSGFDGLYAAYLSTLDSHASPGQGTAAQTTSYVLQSGDVLSLSLLGRPGYTFDGSWSPADATCHYVFYYGGDALTVGTPFASGFFDFGTGNAGDWSSFSVGGIAVPVAAVGSLLGIELWNSSDVEGGSSDNTGSWIGVDNVIVTVPEPGTIALVTLGGLTLVAFRRRA